VICAKLTDNADRDFMHQCLKIIWNKAWREGNFPSKWKLEDRILIAKPGKDDNNDCNAYQTVSVTSALGKRFEHKTSQRLINALKGREFD